ncbi:MAG: sensor histidine kinase [Marmoricola sp.]
MAAGVLCLSRWRITGGSSSGLLGAALILRGAGAVPLSFLDPRAVSGTGIPFEPEVARAVVTAVVAVVVAAALAGDPWESPVRPARVIVVGMAVVLAGSGAIAADGHFSAHLFVATPASLMVLDLGVSALWLAASLLAWTRRRAHRWAARILPLLLGLGTAGALRATAVGWSGSLLPANLVVVMVAGVAVALALRQVVAAVAGELLQRETAVEALTRAEARIARVDDWRQELGHDAINSLTGLRAAVSMLAHGEGRMDMGTMDRLQHAVLDELEHLEHLVAPVETTRRSFAVAPVIEAVVATRRAAGLSVTLKQVEGEALGCPGDLSTVLHNLLVNAERHAPGALVEVGVERAADRLEIRVSDGGPGIPSYLAEAAFERGVRRPGSAGSGLGLHVARQLMRAQSGDLQLRDHSGGCTFVATLPAGDRPSAADLGGAIPRPRWSPEHTTPMEPVASVPSTGGVR